LIERSFQGLSRAIETVEIVEELMKIGLNEVCDKDALCEGDQSRALQEIPQFKLCYRICYNLPPGDSSEN